MVESHATEEPRRALALYHSVVPRWAKLPDNWSVLLLTVGGFGAGLIYGLIRGVSAPLAVVFGLLMATLMFTLFTPAAALSKLALQAYQIAPLVVFFGGWAYFGWYAGDRGLRITGDFFEVTAQIIPVLILTAIVDVRRARRIQAEKIVLTLFLLTVGEVMAMFGILEPTSDSYSAVCGALSAGFAALLLSLLAEGPTEESPDEVRSDTH